MQAGPLTGRLNYVDVSAITRERRGSGVRELLQKRYFPLKCRTRSPKDNKFSLVGDMAKENDGEKGLRKKTSYKSGCKKDSVHSDKNKEKYGTAKKYC